MRDDLDVVDGLQIQTRKMSSIDGRFEVIAKD